MHWILLIVVGLAIGALGRLIHPGLDPMGWLTTLAIGVASLVLAGAIFGSDVLQFGVGIVVAGALVALYGRAARSTHAVGPS